MRRCARDRGPFPWLATLRLPSVWNQREPDPPPSCVRHPASAIQRPPSSVTRGGSRGPGLKSKRAPPRGRSHRAEPSSVPSDRRGKRGIRCGMGRAVREGSSPTRSGHPGIGRSHDSNGASSRETRPCRVEQFRALTFASGVTSPASEWGFHLPNTKLSDRHAARELLEAREPASGGRIRLRLSPFLEWPEPPARREPRREVGNHAPVPTTFQRVVHENLHVASQPAWGKASLGWRFWGRAGIGARPLPHQPASTPNRRRAREPKS
jgi:hypothetical protein